MSLVIGLVTLLILVVAIVAGLGAATPRAHTASSTAEYHARPDSIYAVLADFEHAASWRSDLSGMRRLPDHEGRPVWEQQLQQERWPLEVLALHDHAGTQK